MEDSMEDFSALFAQINWVISIIGAILLSILANLLTNPVQNRLARISLKRSEARIKQLQAHLAQMQSFVDTPPTFHIHVLLLIVRTIFITLVAFAVSDMSFASINFSVGFTGYRIRYPELFYALSQFLTSLLYIIGINYSFAAVRTIRRVQNFPEYRAEIEKTVVSLSKRTPGVKA
jgi:hypothetical protein